MTIIFASGGGRIGNQFINIIHLTAFSLQKNTDIYKVNDNYFLNKNSFPYFLYKVDCRENRWKLNNNSELYFIKAIKNIIYRFSIRLLHLIFDLIPFTYSYKYGDRFSRVNFLKAKIINFEEVEFLFTQSTNKLVIISGWGIRNWQLVYDHLYKIKKAFKQNLSGYVKNDIFNTQISNFLFVHIRNGDFARFDYFKDNFVYDPNVWINAITAVCKRENLKNIVIFTDDYSLMNIVEILSAKGLKIYRPEQEVDFNFIDLFITYASKSNAILCNSSTFSLSLAFIYHNYVYSPDKEKIFIKTNIVDLNKTYPFNYNWQ